MSLNKDLTPWALSSSSGEAEIVMTDPESARIQIHQGRADLPAGQTCDTTLRFLRTRVPLTLPHRMTLNASFLISNPPALLISKMGVMIQHVPNY